tara:strand:+ start:2973 stop:3299 length:327 start_codon:yes stop_codon:yes gene_type:complete
MKQVLEFDGGYPTNQEKEQFVNYVLSFYAEDPKWDAIYPDVGMTVLGAVQAVEQYLNGDFPCIKENWIENEFGVKVPTHLWGGGDSIDREKVCVIFLDNCEKVLDKAC